MPERGASGGSKELVMMLVTATVVGGGSWLILRLTPPGPFRSAEIVALAVLFVAWLVVSFSAATRVRALIEWLGATGLYALLASFFGFAVSSAWQDGSTVRLVAFGFLAALFTAGGLVSLINALLSMRGPAPGQQGATN